MTRRFDCCTPRPKKDGGVWWHKVGGAWENDKGTITIYLDSVPVPDPSRDNKIVFSLFEQTDNKAKEEAPKVEGKEQMEAYVGDKVPF